jgi:two-component system, NarL family, sensor histidine kinase DesK
MAHHWYHCLGCCGGIYYSVCVYLVYLCCGYLSYPKNQQTSLSSVSGHCDDYRFNKLAIQLRSILLFARRGIYQHALNEKKQELILSQKETQRLAKVAERERIARDLHDLIGHTFSVITLKADLAGRIVDKDIDKAKQEIKQIEEISRAALSQVREVVSGYRSSDLLSELANAKNVFASLNINFEYQLVDIDEEELDNDMATNKELAIVLRELVTNIIKHAKAGHVQVTLTRQSQGLTLMVQDDGQGMEQISQEHLGFGLTGIQERIAKLHGRVHFATHSPGTLSEIYVPLRLA